MKGIPCVDFLDPRNSTQQEVKNSFYRWKKKKNDSHRDTERPWLSQVATPETQASSIWAGVVSGALQGVEVG